VDPQVRSWHKADIEAVQLMSALGFLSDILPKMLNSIEDAQTKIRSTFEADEHLLPSRISILGVAGSLAGGTLAPNCVHMTRG
jgi:hypothetical protein